MIVIALNILLSFALIVVCRLWSRQGRRDRAQIEALGLALDSANKEAREARTAVHVALSVAGKVPALQARIDELGMEVGDLADQVVRRDEELSGVRRALLVAVPMAHRESRRSALPPLMEELVGVRARRPDLILATTG